MVEFLDMSHNVFLGFLCYLFQSSSDVTNDDRTPMNGVAVGSEPLASKENLLGVATAFQ